MVSRWMCAAALVLAGCGSTGEGDTPAVQATSGDAGSSADAAPAGPTWHQEVKPIVDRRCVPCHSEGGIAPFALDSYQAAQPLAAVMGVAIESGRMPPWPPDTGCREYQDQRALEPAERDTLLAWVAAGGPEGDPASATPSTPPQVTALSGDVIVAKPTEAYLPSAAARDDYRCFLLDREFPEEVWVRGTQVIPGAGATVHHVLIYVIQGAELAEIQERTAADPGPGYECFGGSGANVPNPVGGWVPGGSPSRLGDDTARVIPAGARLVMQVHYFLASAAPEPDLTEFHMELAKTPPTYQFVSRPLANLALAIPAGAARSVQETTFVNYRSQPLRILQVTGHMHLFGSELKLDLVPKGGSESGCLLSIPRWDFNWQQPYAFRPGDVATANPGDALRLTCVYDNSAANQPSVDGKVLEPADVTWGDGTLDEMCLAYVGVLEPFVPPDERKATCSDFAACRAGCAHPDSLSCLWRCGGDEDACTQCVISKSAECLAGSCLTELIAAEDCLVHCAILGGDVPGCTAAECPARFDALDACATAPLAAGTCDSHLGSCGVAASP